MHYLLIYEADSDYAQRRAPYRTEHLRLAWDAQQRGELVLGGALQDPTDGAVLVFQGDSPEVARRFAEADPYVRLGIVRRWYVRPWLTVVGDLATMPTHPEAAPGVSERPVGGSSPC